MAKKKTSPTLATLGESTNNGAPSKLSRGAPSSIARTGSDSPGALDAKPLDLEQGERSEPMAHVLPQSNDETPPASTGEMQTKTDRWKGRIKAFAVDWKDVIMMAVGIVALMISGATWFHNRSKEKADEKSKIQEAAQHIFDELHRTESRYQLSLPPVIGDKQEPLRLRLVVATDFGKPAVYFTLPRVTAQYTVYRRENTHESEVEAGRLIPVAVQRTLPVQAGNFGAFGCVDCNSAFRLELYLAAQRVQKHTNFSLTASEHVRFARAAIDFGEITLAESHLDLAESSLKVDVPHVYRARIKEDVGKTRLLMGDTGRGHDAIAECKAFWRTSKLKGQLGNLHDVLNWEAQYFCTTGDGQRAMDCLKEMSEAIASYDIGKARSSKMIEDAYATCMALLAAFDETDPKIPVPRQFFVHSPDLGRWVSAVEHCRTIGYGDPLPPSMEWEINGEKISPEIQQYIDLGESVLDSSPGDAIRP